MRSHLATLAAVMGLLAAGATERGCCRALRAHHAAHPGSRHRPPAVTLDRAMQPWLLGLGVQQFRSACRCRQIILIMGAHFAGAVGFALRYTNANANANNVPGTLFYWTPLRGRGAGVAHLASGWCCGGGASTFHFLGMGFDGVDMMIY